jgi:hypothetical protein
VVVVPIDRKVSFAVQNHVIVDDDFGFGDDGPRSVAIERVRTSTFGNGVANTLLGAGEYLTGTATRPAVAAGPSHATGPSRSTATTFAILLTAPHHQHEAQRECTHKPE